MKEFRIVVEIQALPSRVWAVMRDIERWPEWNLAMTSIQRLDNGPLAAGSRARIKQPRLPPADWQVTEWDDARKSFTWVNRGPGVQVTGHHRVEPIGDSSRVTLSLRFSGLLGPLFARLKGKLSEHYLAVEASGLRERCDASMLRKSP